MTNQDPEDLNNVVKYILRNRALYPDMEYAADMLDRYPHRRAAAIELALSLLCLKVKKLSETVTAF